jgi:hypothetical protein
MSGLYPLKFPASEIVQKIMVLRKSNVDIS